MTKNTVCCAPYLKNHTSYDCHLWYTFVISPGVFLNFLKIFIFGVVSGVEGHKMVQNDKNILSVALHISETIHHMIVIYGTLVETNNISRCFFHFFKILILQIVSGLKGQEMAQNDKKFCLSHSVSQEPYIIFVTHV